MQIGFIGAGRMGRPMVHRLLDAGHQVTVHRRTPGTDASLTDAGASVSGDLAGTAESADIVVVSVHTDQQVRDVCLDGGVIAAMAPGSLLVVHTTGSPATAELLAREAVTRAVDVVDAPVSGGAHDIEAGRITLFVGGSDDAVTRVLSVLRAYADPILHVGPIGSGQRVKLINNAVFAAHVGVLAVAADLADRIGLEESAMLDALRHGSGDSRALAGVAASGSVARFASVVGEFLDKDIAVVRGIVEEMGHDLGPLEPLYDRGSSVLPPG